MDGVRPTTTLIVEARDLDTLEPERTEREVLRPAGLIQQRDQVVRAVTELHPEVELHSFGNGAGIFYGRTLMVTAGYAEALQVESDSIFTRNTIAV